jgi:hypothetical protein
MNSDVIGPSVCCPSVQMVVASLDCGHALCIGFQLAFLVTYQNMLNVSKLRMSSTKFRHLSVTEIEAILCRLVPCCVLDSNLKNRYLVLNSSIND